MEAHGAYQTRPIRFLGLEKSENWNIKVYSISCKNEYADARFISSAKANIPLWLSNASNTQLPNYRVATLIIHEGKEGCFAVLSWWIDENVLQLFAYLASDSLPDQYQLISDKGIVSCVWEMAVLWFERNAWVEEVMKNPQSPQALDNYLSKFFQADV